jgi:hypothetical protein
MYISLGVFRHVMYVSFRMFIFVCKVIFSDCYVSFGMYVSFGLFVSFSMFSKMQVSKMQPVFALSRVNAVLCHFKIVSCQQVQKLYDKTGRSKIGGHVLLYSVPARHSDSANVPDWRCSVSTPQHVVTERFT